MGTNKRAVIARRAAQELASGMIVNLGIGIPTMVGDYLPDDVHIVLHGENGILGYGPTPAAGEEQPYLCNAGGLPITQVPETSFFDSTVAFGMIRRGRIDVTILGALQVSETGDLANWIVPKRRIPGMGGAMELVQKAKKVIVVTEHLTKDGRPKILKQCTFPLTARQAVDLIITERAVIEVREDGLYLLEVLPGYALEDVLKHTEADLNLARLGENHSVQERR